MTSVRSWNALAETTDAPVIVAQVYRPDKPGYYEYARIIMPEALETTSMREFFKDDLWFTIENELMEYYNDKQRQKETRTKAGLVKRIVRKLWRA